MGELVCHKYVWRDILGNCFVWSRAFLTGKTKVKKWCGYLVLFLFLYSIGEGVGVRSLVCEEGLPPLELVRLFHYGPHTPSEVVLWGTLPLHWPGVQQHCGVAHCLCWALWTYSSFNEEKYLVGLLSFIAKKYQFFWSGRNGPMNMLVEVIHIAVWKQWVQQKQSVMVVRGEFCHHLQLVKLAYPSYSVNMHYK